MLESLPSHQHGDELLEIEFLRMVALSDPLVERRHHRRIRVAQGRDAAVERLEYGSFTRGNGLDPGTGPDLGIPE